LVWGQDPTPGKTTDISQGETWRLRHDLVSGQWDSQAPIDPLILDLGSASFEIRSEANRKLETIGPRARPFLRSGLESSDPEIQLRCREILSQLPKPPSSFEVRSWLTEGNQHGPPLGLLLNLLEWIEDEALRVSIHQWIFRKFPPEAIPNLPPSSHAGRLLLKFLEGARSPRFPEGALPPPGSISSSGLNHLERYHLALGHALQNEGVLPQTFAPYLGTLPLEAALQLEAMFLSQHPQITPAAFLGKGSPESRAQAIEFWKKGSFTSSSSRENAPLWICEYDGNLGGRIYGMTDKGLVTDQWPRLQGPNDFQILSGGRVLVAERNTGTVTELDRQGNRLWQWQAPASPIQCQRLEGGLTLFATFHEVGVVTPAGQVEWSVPIEEGVRFARADSQHAILILTSRGTILKIDPLGRRLKTLSNKVGSTGAGYWGHLCEKPNGSILACFAGTHLVVEINPAGFVVRQTSVKSPVHIKELPNGGLLVASFDQKCLIELDSQWNEVGRRPLEGRPFSLSFAGSPQGFTH